MIKVKKPYVVWLTGLSGSGKSTIAKSTKDTLGEKLVIRVIDGDEVRNTINKNHMNIQKIQILF